MKKIVGVLFVFGVIVMFSGVAFADLNQGLVAYYPFNGNANDESGNGNNGAVSGATLTDDKNGNSNSAYSFDGVDDYIQVPHNDSFNINPTTGFTVALWFKASATQSGNLWDLIDKSHGDPDYWYEGWVIQGGYMVAPYAVGFGSGNGSGYDMPGTPYAVNADQWHHLAATFLGTDMMLYLDGALSSAISASSPVASAGDLFIGKHYALGRYFHGIIDEVRIYNRALSASEIQELFNPPQPPCWPCTQEAQASVYSAGTTRSSSIFNTLALLLIPVGMVFVLRTLRRKK